jgi:hypothetical protein
MNRRYESRGFHRDFGAAVQCCINMTGHWIQEKHLTERAVEADLARNWVGSGHRNNMKLSGQWTQKQHQTEGAVGIERAWDWLGSGHRKSMGLSGQWPQEEAVSYKRLHLTLECSNPTCEHCVQETASTISHPESPHINWIIKRWSDAMGM